MSFDLAISSAGDLIVSSNGDLAGISGTDLIEQRMRLRMRLQRGAWAYDDDNTLGSQLSRLMGMAPDRAAALAPAYVQEALRAMTEIEILNVGVYPGLGYLTLLIEYRVLEDAGGSNDENIDQMEFTLTGGGST
jgi:hypothetical protein